MQSRLIENDDVLREVFKFLDPSTTEDPRLNDQTEHENNCRGALARSARVSRVLSDHALNVLWRKIEGLLDFFSILPSFRRELIEPRDDDEGYSDDEPHSKPLWRFTGPITSLDWQRYQQYAQRVRVLSLAWTPGKVDPAVFVEIARLSDGGPLFPGLIELDIQTYDHLEAIPSTLISPYLRKLHATDLGDVLGDPSTKPAQAPLAELVRAAFLNARLLEDVSLEGSNVGPMENLLPMTECTRLRRVSLVDVACDARLLSGWSRINCLGDLALEVNSNSSVGREHLEFAHLHCLTVRGDLKCLADLFAHISAPSLNYLRIQVQQPPGHGREQVSECFAALSSSFGSTLRHFHLASFCDGHDRGQRWPEQPLIDIIRPLLDMHMLQTVSITPPRWWSVTLSDEAVRDIATAWPHLVSLQIYLLNAHSTATWESLIELASVCSNLRTLVLPQLDLRTFAPPLADKQPSLYHPLEVLTLDYSFAHNQVEDSHTFAQFLDRTFPNLDLGTSVIRRVDIPGGQRHPLCREVMELLRNFQQSRERQIASSGKHVMVSSPAAQTV
ncbi:uncharacterized protein C8Q71DRAFT_594369 [Rhodofomes roseus]|uniref:F-box domain-containing protein n=1 Tax=Rhodofomes roseus TaxID=34475 RepID=A0ABQ8KIG7_9APHY|nr:uncharacterized protein C8Q71DRAFT_594369 [Rhodofomes roseus]KAH9837281.1 hypothetical protein C8Q71DRAFT_594369 [Rhodofomes roseus]